ncbi:hypothetical protein B296_00020996 [Ensete ventricosum]|uniref:Peptidase S54 rhomboid domain-containing protein n=1 Tax=Ensete ventricosum TaxID=4639 RepID=A0A426ZV69_ENSVE|nr:hypothetical protein B296_00020996 [Ensete ventricosum]
MGHLLALAPMPAVGLLAPPRVPAWRPSAVAAVAFDLSPVGRRSFPSRLKVALFAARRKLVEEEEGNLALWISYILAGAGANLVSWLLLPKSAVSVGASGAVFGLFVISVLVKVTSISTCMKQF